MDGCASARAVNVDEIIPTPQGFILSGSVIQVLSVFWLIMDIGSWQAPLQFKGLMSDNLGEGSLKVFLLST